MTVDRTVGRTVDRTFDRTFDRTGQDTTLQDRNIIAHIGTPERLFPSVGVSEFGMHPYIHRSGVVKRGEPTLKARLGTAQYPGRRCKLFILVTNPMYVHVQYDASHVVLSVRNMR